jgi:predicted phage terminase large subunit-like protein
MIQSWDLAFKDLATSDFVAGQVWAAIGADRFLLDQQRERMDMPRTVEAIRAMSQKWPRAAAKLVEDRANGPAVIASLKHEITGMIAVNPEGGKIARAAAISPQLESGNIYLPHPAIAPWVEALIEECAGFPYAAHDDQVDALTQALNRLHGVSRAIYTVPEPEIAIDPIQIDKEWPCVFAMDARPTETAALWAALNPQTKVWHVFSEYSQSHGEAAIHAQGIRSRGKWVPGLLDPMANGRSQSDGLNLLRIYQELELDLDTVEDSEQSGICEVLQSIRSGRLKVFRSLENFFREYRLYRRDEQGRIVRQNDLLMNCLRYLCVSGRDRMRTQPTRSNVGCGSTILAGTPGGWMA